MKSAKNKWGGEDFTGRNGVARETTDHERLVIERDELLSACNFLCSQVETLAAHAFSGGVKEWLAKCDAYQCGKRAIAKAEKAELEKGNP